MIITNLIEKIKIIIDQNKETLVYIIIIIFVGISSFLIGRISIETPKGDKNEINYNLIDKDNINDDSSNPILENKNYVASKNGKMYYPINCGLVSRIKEENKVWFGTREEAEKSGFIASSSCN